MSTSDTMATDPIGDGMVLPKGYISQNESTFQHQDTLPSLPLPHLRDTLERYLASVKPLVTPQEYTNTENLVKKFENGIGAELQSKLQERAKSSRNWIEHWWENYGYLMRREPHMPYVNFTGPGPYLYSYWPPREGTQCERAGLILWFTIKYWELIRREQLPADRGGRTTVWCMNQFKRMFNGCKTPGMELDKLNDYFKTEKEGPCPTHVVVVCRGRYFYVDTFHPDGTGLTAPEIQVQLEHIKVECERLGQGAELGVLTTENRTTWAKLRQHLISLHPDNERHLMAIQTSILLVALDDRAPANIQELSLEGLIGDPILRWHDKPCQFVFFKNGTMATNGDHAPMEAMSPISMMLFELKAIGLNGARWQGRKDIRPLVKPRELDFHVDATITEGVEQAKHQFAITGSSVELHVEFFTGYGKSFIRSSKLHPDTFMQLAIQLGYYRLYGRPAPTYETASARKFYHGRTETVRSCTSEVIAWAKAMVDPSAKPKMKLMLLMQAMQKHLKLMKDATEGQGCDRHLFGLQLTALESGLPIPDLYKDPSYAKSGGGGNYVLSTSFVGFSECFGGVSPMCKDGYGVFYSIMDERINLFISTWRADESTNGSTLFRNIAKGLDEMKQLVESYDGPKL